LICFDYLSRNCPLFSEEPYISKSFGKCVRNIGNIHLHITLSVATNIKFLQLSDILEMCKTLFVVQLFTLCHPNTSNFSSNETSKQSKEAVKSKQRRVGSKYLHATCLLCLLTEQTLGNKFRSTAKGNTPKFLIWEAKTSSLNVTYAASRINTHNF
jgi:hypothetical protein